MQEKEVGRLWPSWPLLRAPCFQDCQIQLLRLPLVSIRARQTRRYQRGRGEVRPLLQQHNQVQEEEIALLTSNGSSETHHRVFSHWVLFCLVMTMSGKTFHDVSRGGSSAVPNPPQRPWRLPLPRR